MRRRGVAASGAAHQRPIWTHGRIVMADSGYERNVQVAAQEAVKAAGAIRSCPNHPNLLVRVSNEAAQHYAYALATTALKREGAMDARQDVLDAIKAELDAAAEQCPRCGWRPDLEDQL